MSYEHVTLEKADHIATLTLNRPEKLNAFNPKMYRELAAAATEISDDDDMRVGILTGEGRAFQAGADVKQRFQKEIDAVTAVALTSPTNNRAIRPAPPT